MPPTPELHVTVRDDVLADWCGTQKISVPKIRVHSKSKTSNNVMNGVCQGSYEPWSKTIDLYVLSNALATAEGQRLLHVTRLLNETVLHELRHHWQYESWSAEKLAAASVGPYFKQKIEVDARDFASAYKTKLTLIRVKRSYGGGKLSGFGRLGAAQEGARR